MGKRIGIFCLALGALLLVLAAGFRLQGQQEAQAAGVQTRQILRQIKVAIPAATEPAVTEATVAQPKDRTLRVLGEEYLGVLSIPALELELPVMADWSYAKLKKAPCRQAGAVESGDLVIAAHNYQAHFGRLSSLEPGTCVLLTDGAGQVHSYILSHIQTLSPEAVEAVMESGYDLVLYTCTPGGSSRVAAFCIREG